MPTGSLPEGGKKLYEKVYNEELKGNCKGDKECAAKRAWGAVKNAGWKKDASGEWHKKAELQEFSLIIKRTFVDDKNVKRWKADTSDTVEDSHGDNMTIELFKAFINRIDANEPAPEEFKSDFWDGGKPYVSISHYSDLNGKGVPGEVDTVFVDGRFLKAKGWFYDTPLGNAAWNALMEDQRTQREDKVRISIGFLDYGHVHKSTGFKFVRKSLDDFCPECLRDMMNGERSAKSFFDGLLVHFALTRVPVNKRTDISPDDMEVKSEMTTQFEDAESIVGEDQAEMLDELKKSENKSEALVEFSEAEVEKAKKKPDMKDEETPAEDETEDNEEDDKKKKKEMKSEVEEIEVDESELEEKATKKEADCSHPSSHYLVVEDPQKPSTWHLRVKNCAGKPDHRLMGAAWAALHGGYRGNSYSGPNKSAAISKLKKMYSSENLDTPSKADLELAEIREELEVIKSALKEKVMDEQEQEVVEVIEEKSELYPAFQAFAVSFEEVNKSDATQEQKLIALQKPFNDFAEAIKASITEPVVEEEVKVENDIVKAFSEALSPLTQKLDLLLQMREEKSEIPSRVPSRRSIDPAIATPKLLQQEAALETKPGQPVKIGNFVKKSVGLQ